MRVEPGDAHQALDSGLGRDKNTLLGGGLAVRLHILHVRLGLYQVRELSSDFRFISSRNAEFLAVFEAFLIIFDAGSADGANRLATVGTRHVLLPASRLQELNGRKLSLLLLGFLLDLLLSDLALIVVTGLALHGHVLTALVILGNGVVTTLVVVALIEPLVGLVVVGGSVLHLAIKGCLTVMLALSLFLLVLLVVL